jgi:hypothetical protein
MLKGVKRKILIMNFIENEFNLTNYFERIEIIIHDILSEIITYDILDTENMFNDKLIALKVKHYQMKIGEIWQEVIGNYDGFINLKNGHETGLDILSNSRKIIIELKNRTSTDNSSSRKTNLSKLAKFKCDNPDYMCIYANINADTRKKTLGFNKKILHDGVEIEHYVGHEFLKFIFGENFEEIIEFIKNTINKYL